MAKENRDSKSKLKVFFGFAELEGSDATLQDGLRTIATMASRVSQPSVTQRVTKALHAGQKPGANGTAEPPTLFDQVGQPNGQDFVAEEVTTFDAEFEPTEDARERKPKQQRKPTSYSMVGGLNLMPSGKPSLKEFFAEKNPNGQQEQVAVFVYYLEKILGLTSGIGVNHLYTCFKEVQKKVPPDILQAVRNTVNRKAWVDATDPNSLRITTKGENFVEQELPKSKPVSK
jgi:hypothetical protein